MARSDPDALGAFAVRQQAGANYVSVSDFDLDAYLRSHTSGGQVPALQIHQFLAAAKGDEDDRRILADTTVRLTGFVVHDGSEDGAADRAAGFTLARLMIGCCAGDATGLLVTVRGYGSEPLVEDAWVEVTGRFDEALTAAQPQDAIAGSVPVLAVSSLRHVDQPREPYEYPG